MSIVFQHAGIFLLLTLLLSGNASASHPINKTIEIDRGGAVGVLLQQISLRHAEDGRYLLKGKVRRNLGLSVPLGHIDLFSSNKQGQATFQDAEYYWPRTVNRRYKYPSEFEFIVPEELVKNDTLKISYHRKNQSELPEPVHW